MVFLVLDILFARLFWRLRERICKMNYIIAARYNGRGELVSEGEDMQLDCQAARDILMRLNQMEYADEAGAAKQADSEARF